MRSQAVPFKKAVDFRAKKKICDNPTLIIHLCNSVEKWLKKTNRGLLSFCENSSTARRRRAGEEKIVGLIDRARWKN